MAKDAFAFPAGIAEVLAKLQESHADHDESSYREITLEEAAARWREALALTDMYLDPPSSEDIDHLRALVIGRLAMLTTGGSVPAPAEMGEEERRKGGGGEG